MLTTLAPLRSNIDGTGKSPRSARVADQNGPISKILQTVRKLRLSGFPRAHASTLESRMTHISGFERSQLLLLPEAVDDYVGGDNPVRFIDAFVDGLDLAARGFRARRSRRRRAGPATRRAIC